MEGSLLKMQAPKHVKWSLGRGTLESAFFANTPGEQGFIEPGAVAEWWTVQLDFQAVLPACRAPVDALPPSQLLPFVAFMWLGSRKTGGK